MREEGGGDQEKIREGIREKLLGADRDEGRNLGKKGK